MDTKRYLKEIYRLARENTKEEIGVRLGVLRLSIAIISVAVTLAIATYFGLELGFREMWDLLESLFIAEAVLLAAIWLALPVLSIFRMPNVAARRDFAKDELIKTLSVREKPEIAKLGELRTKGVALRNLGASIDPLSLKGWIEDYQQWDKQMLRLAKKISPGTANWLRTLDTMGVVEIDNPINSEHLRYMRIWSEKLKRLDKVIRAQIGIA